MKTIVPGYSRICIMPIFVIMLLVSLLAMQASAALVTYTYDSKGQLLRVDYGSGKVLDYDYDPAGNRVYTESCVAASTLPAGAQPTLVSGYNATTAGATLKARNLTFQENLQFSKSITLKGGFACDFSIRRGISTIKGTLLISAGTSELDTIAIQ